MEPKYKQPDYYKAFVVGSKKGYHTSDLRVLEQEFERTVRRFSHKNKTLAAIV